MKELRDMTPEEARVALAEDSNENLRKYTTGSGWYPEADRVIILAELLRRERERCLQTVCEAVMGGRRRGDSIAEETGVIMTAIRGLK